MIKKANYISNLVLALAFTIGMGIAGIKINNENIKPNLEVTFDNLIEVNKILDPKIIADKNIIILNSLHKSIKTYYPNYLKEYYKLLGEVEEIKDNISESSSNYGKFHNFIKLNNKLKNIKNKYKKSKPTNNIINWSLLTTFTAGFIINYIGLVRNLVIRSILREKRNITPGNDYIEVGDYIRLNNNSKRLIEGYVCNFSYQKNDTPRTEVGGILF